jgi:hypothetical protein
MTQLTIITTPTNSGDGTPLATAFNYCNSNFNELYSRAQVTPPATLVGSVGDQAGMYAYDSSYFYYCFADYDGSTVIWAQVTQVANIAISAITNGSSNVKLVGLNGDATVNINGVSNIAAFRGTGVYVNGAVSATGNVDGSNLIGQYVYGGQVIGNVVSSTGNIVGLNTILSGYITTGTGFSATDQYPAEVFTDGIVMDYDSANSKARFSTGVGDSINFYNNGVGNTEIVVFDSSGNIFADGGFSAVGNVITQGVVSAVGNIITDGYFVGTFVGNVTGNFVVPGANTQVIFNTSGNADAVGGFTYNKDSNTMTVLGIVSSQGNVIGGNLRTASQVSAGGNITGGNINTGGQVSATGNATVGNLTTGGSLTTSGTTINSGITTTGTISATGNITGGNIRTAGQVSTTGNIRTAGYLFVTQDINVSGDITATSYTGTSLSLSGNITGGNLLTAGVISTAGEISAVGNVSGNYFIGNGSQLSGLNTNLIQSGNSNVLIGSSAGNVSININGIAPIALFTPLGQGLTGTFSATGTVTGGNLATSGYASATGNITGANFNTVGLVSATGNVYGGNLITPGTTINSGVVTGTISATGDIISGGNLTVGTGSITVGSINNGNGNGVGNIGSSGLYFNTVFAKATSAQYADLAENYKTDSIYEAGTVVIFGGDAEITTTNLFADVRVAGAISTRPAYLMNSAEAGLPVALRGRIPIKVVGPVNKGDLLVTAGANPGYAVSVGLSTNYPLAVFAKSIETNTNEGQKVITAVII